MSGTSFHPGPLIPYNHRTPATANGASSATVAAAAAAVCSSPLPIATPASSAASTYSTMMSLSASPSPSVPSSSVSLNNPHAAFLLTGGSLTHHLLLKKHKGLPRSFNVELRLSHDMRQLHLSSDSIHPLTFSPLMLGSDPITIEIDVTDLIDACSGLYDCSNVLVEKHVRKANLHLSCAFTIFFSHLTYRNKLARTYSIDSHHHAPSITGFPQPFYFEANSLESANQWVRALSWLKEEVAIRDIVSDKDRRLQLIRLHRTNNSSGHSTASSASASASALPTATSNKPIHPLAHSHSLSTNLTAIQTHSPPVLLATAQTTTSHPPSHSHAFSFGDVLKRAFHHPSTSTSSNTNIGSSSSAGTPTPHHPTAQSTTISSFQHAHAELARLQLFPELSPEDESMLLSFAYPSSSPTPTAGASSANIASIAPVSASSSSTTAQPSTPSTANQSLPTPPILSSAQSTAIVTHNSLPSSLSIVTSPHSSSTSNQTPTPLAPSSLSNSNKVDHLSSILREGQAFLHFPSSRSLSSIPDPIFVWTSPDLNTFYWAGGDRSKFGVNLAGSNSPTGACSTGSIVAIDTGANSLIFGLDKWIFSLTLRVRKDFMKQQQSNSQSRSTIFDHLKNNASGSMSGPNSRRASASTSSSTASNETSHAHLSDAASSSSSSSSSSALLTLHLSASTRSTYRLWTYALRWLRDFKSNVSTPYNVHRILWMDTNLTWGGENLLKSFGVESRDSLVKIGGGGMANVYLITHQVTRQQFALKVFHHYPDIILHEIEIMKSLQHPNCIAYYGCIPRGKELYVIMEWAELGSLKDFIKAKAKEKMKEQHIAYILRQVLYALQYLHSLSILHRDIKCANILLTSKGHIKLTDFGISEHFTETKNPQLAVSPTSIPIPKDQTPNGSSTTVKRDYTPPNLNSSGSSMPNATGSPATSNPQHNIGIGGSPLWMSPEALRGGELTPATDVYSLGVTAIEMAEGVPPNSDCTSLLAVTHAVFSQPSPTLVTHARSFMNPSEAFQDFVDRCLRKEPTDRSTIEQLLMHPFIVGNSPSTPQANATSSTCSSSPSLSSSSVVASARSLLMRGAQLLSSSFSSSTQPSHSSPPLQRTSSPLTAIDRPPSSAGSSHIARGHRVSGGNSGVSPLSSLTNSPAVAPSPLHPPIKPPVLTLTTTTTSMTGGTILTRPSPGELSTSPQVLTNSIDWPTRRSGSSTPTHEADPSTGGLATAAKQRGSIHAGTSAALVARSLGSSPHLSPSSSASNLHATCALSNNPTLTPIASATSTPTSNSLPHISHHLRSGSASLSHQHDEPDDAFLAFIRDGTYTRARFAKTTKAPASNSTPSTIGGDSGATNNNTGTGFSSSISRGVTPPESDSSAPDWEKRSNGSTISASITAITASGGGGFTIKPLKKQNHERQLGLITQSPPNSNSAYDYASTGMSLSSSSIDSNRRRSGGSIRRDDSQFHLLPPSLDISGMGSLTNGPIHSLEKRLHTRGVSHGSAVSSSSSASSSLSSHHRKHTRQFSKLPKLLPSLTLKRTASMSTVQAFNQARHDADDADGDPYDADSHLLPPLGLLSPSRIVRGVTSPPFHSHQRSSSVILEGDEESNNSTTPSSRSHAMRKYSSALPFRSESTGLFERQTSTDSLGALISPRSMARSISASASSPSPSPPPTDGVSSEAPTRAPSGSGLSNMPMRQLSRSISGNYNRASTVSNSIVGDGQLSESPLIEPDRDQPPQQQSLQPTVSHINTDDDVALNTAKPSLHIMSSTSELEADDECMPIRTFSVKLDNDDGAALENGIAVDDGGDDDGDPFSSERATLLRRSSLNQGDGGVSMGGMDQSYVISSHGTLIAGNFAISAQGLHASTPVDGSSSRRSSVLTENRKRAIMNQGLPITDGSPHLSHHHTVDMSDSGYDPVGSPTHREHALSKGDLYTLGQIGKGQNGPVLKAIHLPSLTRVALKSIFAHDRGTRHQLLHELTAYLHFDSDYLVSFLGAYYEDGVITLATEYMDQGSLQAFIKKNGPLMNRPRVFRQIAYQCIAGLKHMHDSHFLHRDIKGDNILLQSRGKVKLADFGLLKDLGSTSMMSHTFLGTMSYLSPERITSNAYSYSSDIWSMGLSFLYALTGRSPTVSSDFFTMMDRITKTPPERLSPETHPGLDEDLCDFVNGMVRMNVDERYTCHQLLYHPFLLGPTGDLTRIPATHLPTDPDHVVWKVDEKNLDDLDLILEFIITKHLLPELQSRVYHQRHQIDHNNTNHLSLSSPETIDSSSAQPPAVHISPEGTTALKPLPPHRQHSPPPLRLPAHITKRDSHTTEGADVDDNVGIDDEESLIETFPVEFLSPTVTVPLPPFASQTLSRDSSHLPVHLVHDVSSTEDEDEDEDDAAEIVAPLSLRKMNFIRTQSQNRWLVEDENEQSNHDDKNEDANEGEDATSTKDDLANALGDGVDVGPGVIDSSSSHILDPPVLISSPAVDVEEETFPTHQEEVHHLQHSIPTPSVEFSNDTVNISVVSIGEGKISPTLDHRLDGSTLPFDGLSHVDDSNFSSRPKFGLSLYISPLESIENDHLADIAILEDDDHDPHPHPHPPPTLIHSPLPSISSSPTPTSASSRPNLRMTFDIGTRFEEDGDETIETFTIEPFDGAQEKELNNLSASPIVRMSMASSSPLPIVGDSIEIDSIELLPLDQERCECLAIEFGCSEEEIQFKWKAKQREMIKRMRG